MQFMQTLLLIFDMLKTGAVNLSVNNNFFFRLTAYNNKIDFNILDKKFIKKLLEDDKKLSFRTLIKAIKVFAEKLRNQGTTVSVSYQGETVFTLGSNAKPKFSHLLTRTSDIQIDNVRKLVQLSRF
jgi:hypothetical protein